MALRDRMRALVLRPADALPQRGALASLRDAVNRRLRHAFDLPSRDELRDATNRMAAIDRRIDAIEATPAGPSMDPSPTDADLLKQLKKTVKKELKKELKAIRGKKIGKNAPIINVGSPKSMKDQRKSKASRNKPKK